MFGDVSLMDSIPSMRRNMMKAAKKTTSADKSEVEDVDAFFDLDKYLTDPSPEVLPPPLSSPTHSSPASVAACDFPEDFSSLFADVGAMPMFDESTQPGELFDQLFPPVDTVMPTPLPPSGRGNGTTSSPIDASYLMPSPEFDVPLSPPVLPSPVTLGAGGCFDIKQEPLDEPPLVTRPSVPPPPAAAAAAIDLDKLDFVLEGAKQGAVRAMFPDLLPTVERLRAIVANQKASAGAKATGSATVAQQQQQQQPFPQLRPVKPLPARKSGTIVGTPPTLAPAPSGSGGPALTIPWAAAAAAASPSTHQAAALASLNPSYLAAAAIQPRTPPAPASQQPAPSRVGRKRKPRPTDPAVILAELTAKRAKNTEAARRSRLRKVIKMETMEAQIRELEDERDGLYRRVDLLEHERGEWMERGEEVERLQGRVEMLERVLRENGIEVPAELEM
ncbi:hypothetical protein HK104_000587 [Borealophlyctis nickersoniae]|nr:hypothetical protein HK104_000587 [Borealophlyctis nickersoniae]